MCTGYIGHKLSPLPTKENRGITPKRNSGKNLESNLVFLLWFALWKLKLLGRNQMEVRIDKLGKT
jgi:hypothetical protein